MKLQGTRVAYPRCQGLRRIPRQDRRREQDHHGRPRADQEMRLGRDGIAGLIGLAVSLALLPQRFGLPKLPIVPVGPGLLSGDRAGLHGADQRAAGGAGHRGAAQRGTSRRGRRRRRQPRRAYGLVLAAFADRRPPTSRCCRCSAFASRPRCSWPAFQVVLERPTTLRQWAMLVDYRGRHGGRHLSSSSINICRCCCRAAAGRVGEPCSNCSATASSPSCSGNTCCRCSWARWSAWSAASLPGVTITMTVIVHAALHLRARSAGGAGGDDRRLRRRLDGRPHHLLPARHPRLAVVDRHNLRRLSDGAQGQPGRAIWLGVWASVWRRTARRRCSWSW